MLINFKPQKGKAFDKLSNKTLDVFPTNEYLVSTKYDGNQIFIVKEGLSVRFFTSNWKEFYLKAVSEDLRQKLPNEDFTLIGEFMHSCLGKLGDRRKSAILTTYRTNFNKSMSNNERLENLSNIRVFDFLSKKTQFLTYEERLVKADNILQNLKHIRLISVIKLSGTEALKYTKGITKLGWEGTMCVEPDSLYYIGKRVNHSIKLKPRPTVDLLCIGTELGTGKYKSMIGGLNLIDSYGREVSVGSGLSDDLRQKKPEAFIGKTIEIEYEQIMDTYIQPTFICIRYDKDVYND